MTRRLDAASAPPTGSLFRVTQPPADPVRVLICEDHEIYRVGLRVLIESQSDLSVVGEVDTVRDGIMLAEQVDSQVVVVRQGLLQGGDSTELSELCSRGATLVLAEYESEIELVRALRAGARGYLSRGLDAPRLLDGIRAVARDEPALDPGVARHLMRYLTEGAAAAGPTGPPMSAQVRNVLGRLTERQCAVALLAAQGLTNDEIAGRLFLTQATVKSHLTAILRRLNINNRIQLAILINSDIHSRAHIAGESTMLG